MAAESQRASFSINDARKLVSHLAKPKPVVYWIDYIISIAIAWMFFVLTLATQVAFGLQIIFTIVSALAFYRATIFTHELTHLPRNTFGLFRIVWNFTCGAVMMLPAFTYEGVHTEHHVRSIYGTEKDGEYWPVVHRSRLDIVSFPIIGLFLPFYYAIRFVVMTPLLIFSRKLRNFAWRWMSSLAIVGKYRRPEPASKKERLSWLGQEWLCFAYAIAAIVLAALSVIPWSVFILWYVVTAIAFFLNALRTLAAHRYRHEGTDNLDETDQVFDSVNVPGILWIAALWAPVGLRFHAMHHLFMRMPYHNLPKAHRTLMRELPVDSPYRETVNRTLFGALRTLWRETGATPKISAH